jgi:hypothetical protein
MSAWTRRSRGLGRRISVVCVYSKQAKKQQQHKWIWSLVWLRLTFSLYRDRRLRVLLNRMITQHPTSCILYIPTYCSTSCIKTSKNSKIWYQIELTPEHLDIRCSTHDLLTKWQIFRRSQPLGCERYPALTPYQPLPTTTNPNPELYTRANIHQTSLIQGAFHILLSVGTEGALLSL